MNNRIRELRKTLNLSQREFAEKIGLKQNAISYMEKSRATVTEQNIKLSVHILMSTNIGYARGLEIYFKKIKKT